jgi:hypothetical protein
VQRPHPQFRQRAPQAEVLGRRITGDASARRARGDERNERLARIISVQCCDDLGIRYPYARGSSFELAQPQLPQLCRRVRLAIGRVSIGARVARAGGTLQPGECDQGSGRGRGAHSRREKQGALHFSLRDASVAAASAHRLRHQRALHQRALHLRLRRSAKSRGKPM